MADYSELDGPRPFSALDAEIFSIRWGKKSLLVDLSGKRTTSKVRISFRDVISFRLLDGLSLQSEDGLDNTGINRLALAYMVEGSRFWKDHEIFLDNYKGAKHFRIITPSGAVDVIGQSPPDIRSLDVVPKE